MGYPMSLRITTDQSHSEFLTIANTEIFQAMLNEMQFIIFPLIDRPITYEKIREDHILFIGCPSSPFDEVEIGAIEQFVSSGKILILVSGSGGDYANNTNLSEITRRFEFEFNPDYVEDEKHFLNFSRIPILHKFKKTPITKRVKQLAYSGCSISILDSSVTPLVLTDADAIPVNTPIMVVSENRQVFGIGGYSLFTDDPSFGIKALDNIRLIYNLFDYIQTQYYQTKKITKQERTKPEKVTIKSAKKHFLKLISENSKKLNEIAQAIDTFWEECSVLIHNKQFAVSERKISSTYESLLKHIDSIAGELGTAFSEYYDLFPNFKETVFGDFNSWYETEAEVRAKLDMIRNNLKSILYQEQSSA